jgi:CHAD domain-containing protein
MNAIDPSLALRDFALSQVSELVSGAASNIRAASQDPHPDVVHDMRVSIRRMQQAMRTFRQYLPGKAVKSIRKELKRIMDPAGELRNHDIAIGLVKELGSGIPQLDEKRARAEDVLREAIREIAVSDLPDRWRNRLGLDAA